jgi:hypothetical protein
VRSPDARTDARFPVKGLKMIVMGMKKRVKKEVVSVKLSRTR